MEHLENKTIQNNNKLQVSFWAKDYLKDDSYPKSYKAFLEYPQRKGWNVDPVTNVLTKARRPEEPIEEAAREPAEAEINGFLQAWLWFGLAYTIIQQGGQPIPWHTGADAGGKASSSYVNTKDLPEALRQWARWEVDNSEGIVLRMIRVEQVLKLAKNVTQRNCAFDIKTQQGRRFRNSSKVLALSIMVMGETLTAVKENIMRHTKSRTKGWHEEDDSGWGPAELVVDQMRDRNWCEHQITLMCEQFRSSATLLLFACYNEGHNIRMQNGSTHQNCTKDQCFDDEAQTVDEGHAGGYQNSACLCSEREHSPLEHGMIGADMEAIRNILNKGNIPLVRFVDTPEGMALQVESFDINEDFNREYATFSHVWSDGWGNNNSNKLCRKKLASMQKQLRANFDNRDVPFWMDTLVVPVRDKDLRRKAISQIYNVFLKSSCTIVLDRGLMYMKLPQSENQLQTAVSILSSSWMRRLWTLQEAFLSTKLSISFDRDAMVINQDLSALIVKLEQAHNNVEDCDSLADPVTGLVRKHLLHGIMGSHGRAFAAASKMTDRVDEKGSGGDDFSLEDKPDAQPWQAANEQSTRQRWASDERDAEKRTANMNRILLVDTYRATRWRTTSHVKDEALALSTLLGLRKDGPANDQRLLSVSREGLTQEEEQDELMEGFWKLVAQSPQQSGSIPPGFIFLPGHRIERRGFGWAPRTWMSGYALDFPDPLGNFWAPAALGRDEKGTPGLEVSYPGFLLHPKKRELILGAKGTAETLQFPVDQYTREWYVAEPITDDDVYKDEIIDLARQSPAGLAIILSRPRPSEMPPEIGLLVELCQPHPAKQAGSEKEVLHCKLVCRLHVSHQARERQSGETNAGRVFEWLDKPTACIGEVLDTDQVWCIDGYRVKGPEENISRVSSWMRRLSVR